MASVADLVAPEVLQRLATAEDLRAGSALANAGAVRLTTFGPLNVLATVETDGGSAHVELRGGSVLTFECSCAAGRSGAFCGHIVAVAVETWRRAPRRRSPAPSAGAPTGQDAGPAHEPSTGPVEAGGPIVPPTGPVRASDQAEGGRAEGGREEPRTAPGRARGRAKSAPAGRPLKVGLQLPEVEREVRWPELRDIARAAEGVGFDGLWVGDHLLYRRPGDRARGPWEAWTTLAGLAEATTRVTLGPLVACTSFHNPAMLAKLATTVDEISGGRLILGLGAGWNETEYRAYGFPFDQRIARFEEAFTIIRTLLREGSVDFDGDFYQARDCELLPRGPRPGGPPLMVGSIGPRMLRITLPYVDLWNAWFLDTGNAAAGVPPLRARVDGVCHEVGRDPAAVDRTVAVLVQLPGGTGRPSGDAPDQAVVPLSGAPDVIAAGLAAYAAEGVAQVQVVLDPITTPAVEAMGRVLEVLDRA